MPYRQLIFYAECGSLADGHERLPRHPGEECHCPEGWGGVNCNGQLEDFRTLRGGIYSSSSQFVLLIKHAPTFRYRTNLLMMMGVK
jgi:hypothetical protein